MKNNQKGIGHVVLVVIILVIAIIGVSGWFVYKNQDKKTSNNTSSSKAATKTDTQTQQTTKTENTEVKKVDTTIYEVNISLVKVEDLSKLPSSTPETFKAYMLDVLKKNTPKSKTEGSGCDGEVGDLIATNYVITKISGANISGGMGGINLNMGGGCPGGAPVLWVLTPESTWEEVSMNGPSCKSNSGGIIYEEFAKECYNDKEMMKLVKNPNGSIKSLAH